MKNHQFTFRCYARPEGDGFIGVCLDLDIATAGGSLQEVRSKMAEAVKSYLLSLDEKNFFDVFPRKALFHIWLDYYRCYFLAWCCSSYKKSSQKISIFVENILPKDFLVIAS